MINYIMLYNSKEKVKLLKNTPYFIVFPLKNRLLDF